jgi:hypothetical protein
MKIPWSISTTVRNPGRLRGFLRVLKILEKKNFDQDNQIKFQVLLIKEKLYKPKFIPQEYIKYYSNPEEIIPYEVAKNIFEIQNYEDPPMRGRQSANPLNKLGFAIARKGFGTIEITELGNRFLAGDYDIGFLYFKSFLKLQFPNPWSTDFSAKRGFNITPFIATLHLIHQLNNKSDKKGLSKNEFCIFISTLINVNKIDVYVEKILEFREEQDKNSYIYNFLKEFYEIESVPDKKINNLYDYGDNIMRCFRMTKYFKIEIDPLGYYWKVDLEPSRMEEIKQLLNLYNGSTIKDFKNIPDYMEYISDINKPELPWEEVEVLRNIAISLKQVIKNLLKEEKISINKKENEFLEVNISNY